MYRKKENCKDKRRKQEVDEMKRKYITIKIGIDRVRENNKENKRNERIMGERTKIKIKKIKNRKDCTKR